MDGHIYSCIFVLICVYVIIHNLLGIGVLVYIAAW